MRNKCTKKPVRQKIKRKRFEALKIAFDALATNMRPTTNMMINTKSKDTALMLRYSDSIKAAWKKGPTVTNRMIDDIAYISIPYMGVGQAGTD
ncbi:MAG: hypothetical protein WDO16_25100 [Bacteroidota bacterium]